ncbi:MAG: dephospho-CoA kinase [Bacilli bacterium]|jgi:dephospho-CoA kinase|nr:dephospho-CoA kinase [Acholeplasmataceae bacterium]
MLYVVGITGGIATGKSQATSILKDLGYLVIDADTIVHNLMQPETKVYKEIVKTFTSSILNNDQTINRRALAEIVFNDENERDKLNAIIHPEVKRHMIQMIEGFYDERYEQLVFVDVPLLYEAGFEDIVDKVIVVYTSYHNQVKRLVARDQISVSYAKLKIAAQMPLSEKCKRADYVLDNDGPIYRFREKLLEIVDVIKKEIGNGL